jgi:tRNA(adenine34) deaminase
MMLMRRHVDEYYMQKALDLAQLAAECGEVPVGCIAVQNGVILATGYNLKETQNNPLLHAEIITIQESSKSLGRWRMDDVTFYMTLEPCSMCAGALVQARAKRVVFGAFDPKGGAAGSVLQILDHPRLNHRCEWLGGVAEPQCSLILRDFFKQRRRRANL